MNADETRGVRVPLLPPIAFALILVVGVALDCLRPVPLPWISAGLRHLLTAALGLLSILFGGWGLLTLWRRKASPEFERTVQTLVQEGPYRFSRNPLYVALSALLATFAGMLDNLWILGGLPLLILYLRRFVIAREERYLRDRFGEAYVDYTRRVRRWL